MGSGQDESFSGDRSLLQSAGRSRPAHGDRVGSGCLYAKMSPRGQGTMTESCFAKSHLADITRCIYAGTARVMRSYKSSLDSTLRVPCPVSGARAAGRGRARSSVFFYHEIL